MDRKIIGALVGLSVFALGCAAEAPDAEPVAADSASESAQVVESEDPSIGVTFAALTVIDCQTEATKCLSANVKGASSDAATCSAKLTDCLADVKLQAPSTTSQGVKETLECGNDGVSCIGDPSGAVACQRKVEKCVVDSVGRVTGLGVGAIAKLLGVALDTVGTVVGATVPVVGSVVKPVAGLVGNVVDAAGHVIKPVVNAAGQILDQTGKVIGTTVNAAGEVIGVTVSAAGQVIDAGGKIIGASVNAAGQLVDAGGKVIGGTLGLVGDVVGAGGQVIGGTIGAAGGLLGGLGDGIARAAQCSTESQKCWRDTRDYGTCQKQYNGCVRR